MPSFGKLLNETVATFSMLQLACSLAVAVMFIGFFDILSGLSCLELLLTVFTAGAEHFIPDFQGGVLVIKRRKHRAYRLRVLLRKLAYHFLRLQFLTKQD